ncbi:unnamed protein product [Mytilus coruscus]|uniref:SMB domain-containing protein n=1 Tax=Mytilus coruscus TaxID=42192 RepID=A0A6J8C4Q8_MYTCO|nr:unnamed protein product [Mytilus coruscus]
MNLLYMFLAIGSTVKFVAADSHHYNISTLLEVYTLTCGQHFCNHYDYNLPVTSHHSHICPYCSCDPSCIFYGDCCLDLYLSLNIQCINTTSISYMEHDSESVSEFEDFFIMKTTCPENTTVYLRQQCEGFKNVSEQVKLLPVTSKDTHFTYQNRFCAECNYDSNIELWSLNAVCDRPVDFNFMSNIEEILEATMINKCTFGSFLSNPFVRGCRKVYGENIISSCNVTGTWESYDPSIEWACRNYDNLYHTFRNVFCYICNPPVSMNPVIGQCNTTGDWDTFDNLHIKACNDLGHTPTTYPFKNVFCYACNINSNKKDYLLSQDAFKKIKESIHNERYFKYEFTSVIIANLADLFLAELKNVSHNQQKRKQNNLRTELYHKYYAMTGNGDFCTNVSNSIEQDGRCSCDEYCHFNLTNPCCIDAVFKKSTACVSSKNFDLLVYDGCENILEGSNPLAHKCLSTDMTNENNFLSLLPVTDTIFSVNYRNIYCGLCRYFTNYDELYANQFIYLMETFRFWNFIYICEAPLPISYHVSFFELLNYKHQSKCNFTFDPVYCGKLCDKNKKEVAMTEIHHLNGHDGSNIFCAMCETESQVPTIDSCNSTGRWERYDETLKQKCISLPAVPYHRPYKNIFCKMCNEETQRYNGIYSIEQKCDVMDNYTKPILFRTLFSVLLHSDGEIYDSSKRTCEENEIFDSMIVRCREILCYPGRILINTRCVPLISYTSNLGYVLAFGIDFLLPFNVENPNTFMESIQEKIWSHIGVFVGLPDPFIEVSIISTDRPCNVYDKWTVGNIHMTVFLKIFISRTVYRAKIEENLFKVMYSTFTFFLPCSVSSNVCQIGGKLRFDENALYLPTVLTFQSLQNKCVFNKVNNITNTAGYEHQQVSSLFGCSQIQLEKDEIKVTEDGRQLTINRFGVVLRYYEFLLMKNNSARICHSAFLDLLKVNEQTTPVNQFKQMFTSCKTGKANKKTMTALVSSVPGKRFSFKDKTSSEYEYRQKLHTTKI